MLNRGLSLLLVAAVLAGCGGDPGQEPAVTRGPGAATPVRAVEELVEHLNAGEFTAAAAFALEGQAALASLAEGASAIEVADALESGDQAVAANFWGGFAQGTGSFLIGPVGYQGSDPVSRDGREFAVVIVNPPDGGQREVLLVDEDGYRVDLFASFGSGLAPRMIQPVERLLTSSTNEARDVLIALRDVVPSLLTAAERPGMRPESVQSILQLVEVITRLG